METRKMKSLEKHEVGDERVRPFPPACELLSDPEIAKSSWPADVVDQKEFIEQIQFRKELARRLESIITVLSHPDLPLEKAIEQGLLEEERVADLFDSLCELLKEGSEYQRVLLYLPFEFLPASSWMPKTARLKTSADIFKKTYLQAWERLLVVHDVRANFVDGDVMEVKTREKELPRVVKAAHLVPKLVELGWMSKEDVNKRLATTDDVILQRSLKDALAVIDGMYEVDEKEQKDKMDELAFENVEKQIAEEYARIDAQDLGRITKKRESWLRSDMKRKSLDAISDKIKKAIETETLVDFDVTKASAPAKIAYLEGVRKAVESSVQKDAENGKALYAKYKNSLESLWQDDNPQLKELLAKMYRRLYGLEVVTQQELNDRDVSIPALAGPFSENLRAMETEMEEVRKIVKKIEQNPELSASVFPVVLVYGSRLKGYGSQEADIDVAVFVKPGVVDKVRMRELLQSAFSHKMIGGEVMEFWTREKGEAFEIVDPVGFDPHVIESYSTHVLFGAAWEGGGNIVDELRKKILVSYFRDTDKMLFGHKARQLYLEELERDTLQYRLMHKGYERFYPSYGGIQTPHADRVDGQSAFWDSGYRQLATKLFVNRVFLPRLGV